jgi:uncharacterized SAM-binding protein YcdF (DUF218 family)
MFEYLKLFITPIIWVLFFLVYSLVLTHKAKRQSLRFLIGWYFGFLSLSTLFLLSIGPVESLLVNTLESRYKPVSESDLARIDVIIILGGGVNPSGSFQKTPEASEATYSRLLNGLEAFKNSKARKLILSGRGYYGSPVSESATMRDLAIKSGFSESKIIIEEQSHNTREQAQELRKMGVIDKNDTIGLVTSAMHMMRAYWSFKKEFPDVEIIPIPAGYVYGLHEFSFYDLIPNAESFRQSSLAIHEWLGLLSYKLQQGYSN